MEPKPPKLTIKQQRFCEEYVLQGVAIHAYFAAFGRITKQGTKRSYGSANQQCHRLLAMPQVQQEIASIRQAASDRCHITLDALNQADAEAAFVNITSLVKVVDGNTAIRLPDELPPEVRRCIKKVKFRQRVLKDSSGDHRHVQIEEVEYELIDPLKARENLAKRLGLDRPTTPLEELLKVLSPDLRAKVWAEIAPRLNRNNN